ncbi:MAG TPA: hypothetical protein V6D04_13925 [Candidatus Obscuribacterales bacterium]
MPATICVDDCRPLDDGNATCNWPCERCAIWHRWHRHRGSLYAVSSAKQQNLVPRSRGALLEMR